MTSLAESETQPCRTRIDGDLRQSTVLLSGHITSGTALMPYGAVCHLLSGRPLRRPSRKLDSGGRWAEVLRRSETLKDGWNGYDAAAPAPAAVDNARRFLAALRPSGVVATRVAPSVVGGVGITIRRRARKVYVEFYNDGSVIALFSDGAAPATKRVAPIPGGFEAVIPEIKTYLHA